MELNDTQLKAEIDRLQKALEQQEAIAKKMTDELNSLAFIVSHDLKAPLRAIGGYSRILKEEFSAQLGEEGNRICDIVFNSGNRLSNMIDGVLLFSRVSRAPLSLGKVDTHALVELILKELLFNAENTPSIKVAQLPSIHADYQLFQMLWKCLLENSIKFTASKNRPTIEISYEYKDDQHLFIIRDNGVGFDEKYQDKLFQLFQKIHSRDSYPGVGTGLALAQRIIDKHGGKIWGKGMPGEGASFYFSLPTHHTEH